MRIGRPAANVEHLSGASADVFDTHRVQATEVPHIEQIPNLSAVSVDDDGHLANDGMDEVRHPALILVAILVGPINTGLSKHDGLESKAPGVITHVLVGRAL